MNTKYFTLIDNDNSHVLIHIPHSSLNIPNNMSDDYLLTKKELEKETKIMADMFTDELFKSALNKYGGIKLDVSRVFLDVERFRDDKDEPMADKGMGLAYVKTSDLKELRTLKYKKEILDIYDEYHLAFEKLVEKKLAKHNKCLIIDCHSFPSKPRPYQQQQDYEDIKVCIGFVEYHKEDGLIASIKANFKDYKVSQNRPYSGSIVPLKYYKKDNRVKSVMIEIDRSIYMDDNITFKKNDNYKNIENLLDSLCL
jgi:N-formylglutamate amidohydrolase